MTAELAQIGLVPEAQIDPVPQGGLAVFFPAVKPEAAGTFPSIGARGCFLSHLGVLERAQAAGHRAILILEDDADIVPARRAGFAGLVAELDGQDWAIAYPGFRTDPAEHPGEAQALTAHWRLLEPDIRIETTHAMLIHQRAFAPLIAYFHAMMARPMGHPEGGPMHVDGAYSWFRRSHPQMRTLVTPEPHVVQRASQSDIAPATWRDRLPFVALLRQLRNRLGG